MVAQVSKDLCNWKICKNNDVYTLRGDVPTLQWGLSEGYYSEWYCRPVI